MAATRKLRIDKVSVTPAHPYAWAWEPLELEPSFDLKPMFGGKAVYLEGRLRLFFIAKKEPWRGLLVCTEREHHPALKKDFPALRPHTILPKWLYLSEGEDDFERDACSLVKRVRMGDARIGIVKPRRPRRSARP